jgi:hypothetical protein
MLPGPNSLGMIEAVGRYTGKKIGPTHFRGQLPIDVIWATPDVTIANSCIMLAGYGIGDHRPQTIHSGPAHLLISRARPTEGTTSSLEKAQYTPPTCC